MSWDFETDPEFQAELDWVDDFVRKEVEPVDQVVNHAWDMKDPVRQALIPPLQQQVRDRGLWACHLGPNLGGPGLRPGQAGPAQRDPRPLAQRPDRVRLPGARLRQRRDPRPLRHRRAQEALPRAAAAPGDRVGVLDDRAARRVRPDRVRHPRRARRRRVGDQRREVVLVARQLRRRSSSCWPSPIPRRSATGGCRCSSSPADTPGVEIVRNVGVYGHPEDEGTHSYVRYTDVRIPADHLLGGRGEGFVVAQTRLGGGRIHHAMRTVGLVKQALDQMCERALSRSTQGEMLARKQLVQAMIADSWIQIEQFRLLVLRTAWKIDKYDDYQRVRADISAVKAAMPKVLHDVACRALQIHGSLGVSHEMPFASMVLESFHMGLADGATEVHQITLARELLKGYTPTPDLFPTRHIPKLKAEAEARFADVLASAGRI